MIKLLLFDVGETLIHNNVPFPHVVDALESVSSFETAAGDAVKLGIVSDYHLPAPPPTEDKIAALEQQFLEILIDAGLTRFFEPAEECVTLSTRAGVFKSDRKIFELAVQRSGTGTALNECLFVSENSQHLQACRQNLQMTVLRFGSGAGLQPSFSDWAEAPALIASQLAAAQPQNFARAASAYLRSRHDLQAFHSVGGESPRPKHGEAQQMVQLHDPRLGDLDGVYVNLPVEVDLTWSDDGKISNVNVKPPSTATVKDSVQYVASLVEHKQVAPAGSSVRGATHEIREDPQGRRHLQRRRYSAF